jgi:hypothetical protein
MAHVTVKPAVGVTHKVVVIKSPQDGKAVNEVFIATGLADPSVKILYGYVKDGSGTEHPCPVLMRRAASTSSPRNHWVMLCNNMPDDSVGNTEVHVIHFEGGKQFDTPVKNLKVGKYTNLSMANGGRHRTLPGSGFRNALTIWPQPNEQHICSEGFTPFGQHDNSHYVSSVSVTDSSSQIHWAETIYDDPVTCFWYAQFSDLPDDTYDLTIEYADTTTGATSQDNTGTGLGIAEGNC